MKNVIDLIPGDVVQGEPRIVRETSRTATSFTVTYEDGGEQTWDLSQEPAVITVNQ